MFFKKLWPALLWASIIFFLCAIPGNKIPHLTFLDWLKPDKIVHFVLFGILCFLLIKGFVQQTSVQALSSYPKLISFIFSSIYGGLIELAQEYIFTTRSAELFDAIADSVGALLGILVYNYFMKKKLAQRIF